MQGTRERLSRSHPTGSPSISTPPLPSYAKPYETRHTAVHSGAAWFREELGIVPPQDRRDVVDAYPRERGLLRGKRDARGYKAKCVGGTTEQHHREREIVDGGARPRVCGGQHGKFGRHPTRFVCALAPLKPPIGCLRGHGNVE